jgi:hypothetical protein
MCFSVKVFWSKGPVRLFFHHDALRQALEKHRMG